MSFLSKLIKDKENSEKYNKEAQDLKECVLEINNLYTIHDGEFLLSLQEFLNQYKQTLNV